VRTDRALPVRSGVVSVTSGKIGAAASPTIISPSTATNPGPGTAMTAAPSGTQATPPASTRCAPTRSATGPRTARPANIIAQYAATATPATGCDSPRPAVRNR
jgi:hypothetical protein